MYRQPRVIAMSFLGFSGGLPFLLVFSTLTAWLTDENVARGTIGFFAWVGITYSVKVLWAPVADTLPLPVLSRLLGHRRAWMLLGQSGIALGLVGVALTGPANLLLLSGFALLVAFSSATQDIAIDAYRIEAADETYQGAMSAAYVFGYRLALLVAGAGALYIAAFFDWVTAYLTMAALMGVGVVTVMLIAEPGDEASGEKSMTPRDRAGHGAGTGWLRYAVVGPFAEFFGRNGRMALIILLFIAVYRLSDITMGIMANPFYLDMGYSKADIANVAKVFGFFMALAGSFVCGLLVLKWGVMAPLLVGALAVSLTNLLFVALAGLPADIAYLALVISADNVSGGFAATAFVAYLSGLTNRAYTATQYALFSSLMTLPGKFISGFSGLVVESYGYADFFLMAAALGLPAILLVLWLSRTRGGFQGSQA